MALPQVLRRASASAGRFALLYMQSPRKQLIYSAASWGNVSSAEGLLQTFRSSHPLVRYMSSGSSDGGLLRVLKSEIEHETEQEKTQTNKNIPPKPFSLHDKPGTQEIILRRSYGSEDIAITCVLHSGANPADEDEADDNGDSDGQFNPESVLMTISISKGGDKPTLEISCVTSGDDFTIERVAYLDKGSDKDPGYGGPEFVELDEDLQKQFQRFLDTRGINEDLADFLMHFMPEKVRQEYVRWLKNVEAFLKI